MRGVVRKVGKHLIPADFNLLAVYVGLLLRDMRR